MNDMKKILYNNIMYQLNNDIKNIIQEQFNVKDLDLNDDDTDYQSNIFNKNMINPYDIYNKIISNYTSGMEKYKITHNDLMQLNDFKSVVHVNDRVELLAVINRYENAIDKNNITYSLNWLDVSAITDMSLLFVDLYNIDISEWDVSNVTEMSQMFVYSRFNGDISKWDVHNVTNMSCMFKYSKFNGDISRWDVSNVTNMSFMFEESNFNQDISSWDVSNVKMMTRMFTCSKFNQDISSWDVNNVTMYSEIFNDCPIKEDYIPIRCAKLK